MTSSPQTSPSAHPPICPFCGTRLSGRPNRCGRCGTLLGAARDDLKREGARRRRVDATRRAAADLYFLVGLLLGGPLMTFGGEFELGLFVVLAGGTASFLRRYASISSAAAGVIGTLLAVLAAQFVVHPVRENAEETDARAHARSAFVQALDRREADLRVDARGPWSVAVWFEGSEASSNACGEFPTDSLRAHLRDLGFARVVVRTTAQDGGLCSFPP